MEAETDSPETLALFNAELDLVDRVVRQLLRTVGRNADADELRSYGLEGLLTAARRFDPSLNVPFRGYATFRVRGAIIDGIRKSSRLPRRVYEKLRFIEQGDRVSEQASEEVFAPQPPGAPRPDAQRLLDDHLAKMATAMALGLIPERARGEDGDYTVVAGGEDPESSLATLELRRMVAQAVDDLPSEEAELVRRHYFEGERFDHVAEDLGLSKSWASRLHTRAIGRLTKRLQHKI